jgi:6-phosphofructokinase 2
MIVTVTMNPAVDKSTTVDKLIPEKKLRCTELIVEAGGGGINVSKAIKELGGSSQAIFTAGGGNGQLLQQIMANMQINSSIIGVKADTRENFTATEQLTNTQYRFVMPGGRLSPGEIERCLQAVSSLKPFPSIIIASGSLPPGAPDNFFARLASISRSGGAKFIVDTSGIPLQLAAREGVYLLKPNLAELCSLAGKESLQLDEVMIAAREIVKKGTCEVLVVSMGAAGAMLFTKDTFENIPAPIVKKLSTVGAGDSMVAGMVWMLMQNKPIAEVVRFGIACGTAATMNAGTKLFNRSDAIRLYNSIGGANPCQANDY